MSIAFRHTLLRLSSTMSQTPPFNGRYGRDRLISDSVFTRKLYLDGLCFTAADLRRARELSAAAPASCAAKAPEVPALAVDSPQPAAADVLVRHEPCECTAAIASERAERNLQCAELQRAIQEADLAAKQITLQRNAYRRGRQWFVAGEKVAGGSLKVSDGSTRRFVEIETTLEQAVKQLAAEVDKLHASGVGASGPQDAE